MLNSVEIATGESVAFTYELAGLGSRFIAVAIDMAIQVGVVIAALVLFIWLAGNGGHPAAALKADPAVKLATAVLEGLLYFAAFMLFFGYFIVFEWRFAGRTPGKRLVGLRVVRDGGFPLDFTSAVTRNVVRILEFALGFYAVSALATILSPMNRRLGDMAAGTIVIRDGRLERTAAMPEYAADERRDDALARDLSPAERELVRRFVERRETLKAEPRRLLAKQIAGAVRPKLAASFAHLDDDDLLVHVERGLR